MLVRAVVAVLVVAAVVASASDDHTFTAFCAHDTTSIEDPSMLNCGNIAGMHFYLENGGLHETHGITEFKITVKGLAVGHSQLHVSPAHVFVQKGVALQFWQENPSSKIETKTIEHLDVMTLHKFSHFKLGPHAKYSHLFHFQLPDRVVVSWLNECEHFDVKCLITLPHLVAHDSHASYTSHKVQSGTVAHFMSIPRLPRSPHPVKNPFDMTDAELTHASDEHHSLQSRSLQSHHHPHHHSHQQQQPQPQSFHSNQQPFQSFQPQPFASTLPQPSGDALQPTPAPYQPNPNPATETSAGTGESTLQTQVAPPPESTQSNSTVTTKFCNGVAYDSSVKTCCPDGSTVALGSPCPQGY